MKADGVYIENPASEGTKSIAVTSSNGGGGGSSSSSSKISSSVNGPPDGSSPVQFNPNVIRSVMGKPGAQTGQNPLLDRRIDFLGESDVTLLGVVTVIPDKKEEAGRITPPAGRVLTAAATPAKHTASTAVPTGADTTTAVAAAAAAAAAGDQAGKPRTYAEAIRSNPSSRKNSISSLATPGQSPGASPTASAAAAAAAAAVAAAAAATPKFQTQQQQQPAPRPQGPQVTHGFFQSQAQPKQPQPQQPSKQTLVLPEVSRALPPTLLQQEEQQQRGLPTDPAGWTTVQRTQPRAPPLPAQQRSVRVPFMASSLAPSRGRVFWDEMSPEDAPPPLDQDERPQAKKQATGSGKPTTTTATTTTGHTTAVGAKKKYAGGTAARQTKVGGTNHHRTTATAGQKKPNHTSREATGGESDEDGEEEEEKGLQQKGTDDRTRSTSGQFKKVPVNIQTSSVVLSMVPQDVETRRRYGTTFLPPPLISLFHCSSYFQKPRAGPNEGLFAYVPEEAGDGEFVSPRLVRVDSLPYPTDIPTPSLGTGDHDRN